MGRGRQKAKQQKIARKLKYLTTDTDYDELAKELSGQEPGVGSADPFDHSDEVVFEDQESDTEAEQNEPESEVSEPEDDLDEYAKWAAEAAAKATSAQQEHTARPHKPIPMPLPSALRPKQAK